MWEIAVEMVLLYGIISGVVSSAIVLIFLSYRKKRDATFIFLTKLRNILYYSEMNLGLVGGKNYGVGGPIHPNRDWLKLIEKLDNLFDEQFSIIKPNKFFNPILYKDFAGKSEESKKHFDSINDKLENTTARDLKTTLYKTGHGYGGCLLFAKNLFEKVRKIYYKKELEIFLDAIHQHREYVESLRGKRVRNLRNWFRKNIEDRLLDNLFVLPASLLCEHLCPKFIDHWDGDGEWTTNPEPAIKCGS